MTTLTIYGINDKQLDVDISTSIFGDVNLSNSTEQIQSDCEELVVAQSDPFDVGGGTIINKGEFRRYTVS